MRSVAWSLALSLGALMILSQCGGKDSISLSDYNTRCRVDSDCVVISTGSHCPCANCGDAAINRADYGKYQEDSAKIDDNCTEKAHCADCPGPPPAYCSAGVCALGAITYDAGAGGSDTGSSDASDDH
jgi:hypothetical protein